MKEGLLDNVLDGMKVRLGKFRGTIHKELKGTKRFRQEPVSQQEQIQNYLSLKPEDIDSMIAEYGEEAVNQFIFENEQKMRNYA